MEEYRHTWWPKIRRFGPLDVGVNHTYETVGGGPGPYKGPDTKIWGPGGRSEIRFTNT